MEGSAALNRAKYRRNWRSSKTESNSRWRLKVWVGESWEDRDYAEQVENWYVGFLRCSSCG